jgi:tryptophan synthase alpha chain
MTQQKRRIDARFTQLAKQGKKGLVSFITASDPSDEICAEILGQLPQNGVDFIELGMPFSDPMADGPIIQDASIRALRAGGSMKKTFSLVRNFRLTDDDTPLILMGYFNPILAYETDRFFKDAADAGVDGVIIVDVPLEEETEISAAARHNGVAIIRLVTPTTDDARLDQIVKEAQGFLYYVAVAGVTGAGAIDASYVGSSVQAIKAKTDVPVVVGFGIKTPQDAKAMAVHADAVVVGSRIVDCVREVHEGSKNVSDVLNIVRDLKKGLA